MLGYSLNHRGYTCLDVFTGRVYLSRHVFDESSFPFLSVHSKPQASSFSSPTSMHSFPIQVWLNPGSRTSILGPMLLIPSALPVLLYHFSVHYQSTSHPSFPIATQSHRTNSPVPIPLSTHPTASPIPTISGVPSLTVNPHIPASPISSIPQPIITDIDVQHHTPVSNSPSNSSNKFSATLIPSPPLPSLPLRRLCLYLLILFHHRICNQW